MVKKLLLLLTLVYLSSSVSFFIGLQSYQKQCFYQSLQAHQKYVVDVTSQGQIAGLFEVQVSNMIDGSWNSLVYKQSTAGKKFIEVHKLSPTESTYAYCIRNIGNQKVKLRVSIHSGLQLMEFHLLPDKSDAENLEREITWLEGQKEKLFEILERMDGLRSSSQNLTNLMSTKMIGFGIIGLASIIVVNVLFYRELKKTFKQRKLI